MIAPAEIEQYLNDLIKLDAVAFTQAFKQIIQLNNAKLMEHEALETTLVWQMLATTPLGIINGMIAKSGFRLDAHYTPSGLIQKVELTVKDQDKQELRVSDEIES